MTILLIFSIALFVAVLLSELADRNVFSMAVLFLLAGRGRKRAAAVKAWRFRCRSN